MSILILSLLSVIHASEVKLQCHLTEKKEKVIDSNNLIMPVPPIEMTSFSLSVADTVLNVDFNDGDLIHLNLSHQKEGSLLEGDYNLKDVDASGLLMAGEHILSEGEKIQLECFLSSVWTHPISPQKLSLMNNVLVQRIARIEHIVDVLDVNMDHYNTRKNRFLMPFASFMALELLQVAFLLTTDAQMVRILTPVSSVLFGGYAVRSLIVNNKRVKKDKEERSIIDNKVKEMRGILLGLKDDITLFMSDLESELKEDSLSSAQVMRKVEMFNQRIGQTLHMKIVMEIPRLLSRLSNQNPNHDLQYLLPSIDIEESFVNGKIHKIIFGGNLLDNKDDCESELEQLADTIYEQMPSDSLSDVRPLSSLKEYDAFRKSQKKEGIDSKAWKDFMLRQGESVVDDTSRERYHSIDFYFGQLNIPRKRDSITEKKLLRNEIKKSIQFLRSFIVNRENTQEAEKRIRERVRRITQKCLFLPRKSGD